jgi:hypothetical protein
MVSFPTMETALVDRAHLFRLTAREPLGHESVRVGRIITMLGWCTPVPVLNKNLLEDVPVPRGFCDHRGAPSWSVGIVAVTLFYHASSAPSTPAAAFSGACSPTSLPLESWGLQGSREMKFPRRSS